MDMGSPESPCPRATPAVKRDSEGIMSMYTQLLGAALDKIHRPDDELTTGAMLAELLRCRSQLVASASSHIGSGWAPSAVADELAYDIALIELARHLGIECDGRGFDQPRYERTRLERAVVSRGIRLDELDQQAQPTSGQA